MTNHVGCATMILDDALDGVSTEEECSSPGPKSAGTGNDTLARVSSFSNDHDDDDLLMTPENVTAVTPVVNSRTTAATFKLVHLKT